MENFSELHNICLKVFESVATATGVFLLPLFLGKIVFSNIAGEGSKVFETLRGAVLYFALIAGFPLILDVLFSIPEAYLPKFDSMSALTTQAPGWEFSAIPFSLDRIIEVILSGLYWVVYYLHVFFMILMCSMAPVVFLLSTLLGVGLGLEIFMGLLVVGSSWPIIWYGFDQVHANLVNAQSDAFGAKCLELLITVFKGLAPVSFASIAVKSPAGKAITQAAQGAVSVAKWTIGKTVAAPVSAIAKKHSGKSGFSAFQKRNNKPMNARRNSSNPVNSVDRLSKARVQEVSKGVNRENPQSRNPKA